MTFYWQRKVNERVLLLPKLNIEQSKRTSWEENWSLFPKKPEFNQRDKTIKLWWPKCLWHTSPLF